MSIDLLGAGRGASRDLRAPVGDASSRALSSRRLARAFAALALAISVPLAGCSGSAPDRTEPPPPAKESPEFYERVLIDSPGRTDHGKFVAYVGQAELRVGGEAFGVTRVYDANFRTLGFFLENGACYALRTGNSGEEIEEFLGNHEPSECIERISRVDGPFRFEKGL